MSLASSLDGQKVLAGTPGPTRRSTDGGVTWSDLPGVPQNCSKVTSSEDGERLSALDSFGVVHTSPDGGRSWYAQPVRLLLSSSFGQPEFAPLVGSRDGSRLAGLLYTDSTQEGIWLVKSELLNRGLQGTNRQSATLLYVGDGRWVPMATSVGVATL